MSNFEYKVTVTKITTPTEDFECGDKETPLCESQRGLLPVASPTNLILLFRNFFIWCKSALCCPFTPVCAYK